MRTIQNLWYWRFSAKDINKKIKTDNNSVANQHNEKICLNSSLASKHIISTSTFAQFSVHQFQGRSAWLFKCAFSLKLIKLEHRCAINQSQRSHVMFAVFGTEDEVFLVQCASTSRKCQCKEEPLTILQATACTSEFD